MRKTFRQGAVAIAVLNSVDLALNAGEIVALVGPSGAGKSTMLHVAGLLEQVGLAERLTHRPARLSGGEQQRVAIVRALANDPDILLADEPTGNLDHTTAAGVMDTLIQIVRAQGLAALIATHNLELAGRLDRIVALEDGRLKPVA